MAILSRAALGVVLACASAPALAAGVARIGLLSPLAPGDAAERQHQEAFVGRLRELGYAEGASLVLERRYAEGQYDRLPMLAAELVRAKVDVIVANGTPATSAARRASGTVPVVATTVADPVASGFAASLAHPGGNVTGFAAAGSAADEQRLALLLEAFPGSKRLGVLAGADEDFRRRVLPALEAAAEKRGCALVLVNAESERGLREGISAFASRKVGAVLVAEDPFLDGRADVIARLALEHRLPTLFAAARGAESGGLLAHVSDARHRYRAAADYVDRILRGAKPGELPFERPTRLEIVVNARTAKALGVALPPAVMGRASRVIE